jgi:Carboxypeptidase regulatory-like domain
MRKAVALVMAVIALGAAGCGGTADRVTDGSGDRHGRIVGTLRMIGGPAPGRRLLRHAGIRVYAGGAVVASTTTDAEGRFRLVLPAGRYRITLRDGSRLQPTPVDVTAGTTDRLHLTLSVK